MYLCAFLGWLLFSNVSAVALAGCAYSREKVLKDDFFRAVKAGRTEVVRAFLRRDPFLVVSRDDFGYTPLLLAVSCERDKMVGCLLKAQSDVNAQSACGDTALLWAVELDEGTGFLILEQLLEAGAAVNVQNRAGFTPLMVAALRNKRDIVARLLQAGADPALQTKHQRTALDLTCCERIKSLLRIALRQRVIEASE
jgi:hypothetical protein